MSVIPRRPHLFVDISAHGFGHLAQTAPVLNALARLRPGLKFTVRSALPRHRLATRIEPDFDHLPAASDFGFRMIDAVRIDHAGTQQAYREMHADFPGRVAADAALLQRLGVDAVFANVAYLPLAGAAEAGLPAAAMCSLNWATLFDHFYGREAWAAPVLSEIRTAYRSALFLRTTPGMPMPELEQVVDIGTLATPGRERREELREKLGVARTARLVLVALGGIPLRLPVESWPCLAGTHWLVPAAWQARRDDCHAFEDARMSFVDLLRSADAVVTKPGYGTFAEAAANGTAVIYQRREDWPEQDALIDWLGRHARCVDVSAEDLAAGRLAGALEKLAALPRPTPPSCDGDAIAARHLAELLQR